MIEPSRLDEIVERADAAQVGRLPSDPEQLAGMLSRSSATRAFIVGARRDVLDLAAEVRRLRRERDDARAEAAFYRDEARMRRLTEE